MTVLRGFLSGCVAISIIVSGAGASPAMQPRRVADPRLPRALLQAGSSTQEGSLYAARIVSRTGDTCRVQERDGIPRFGPAVTYLPGEVSIALFDRKKPSVLELTAYRAGINGMVLGPGESVPFELHRRVRGSSVTWEARFSPGAVVDYYVDVQAQWSAGPCGTRSAAWSFHMQVGP